MHRQELLKKHAQARQDFRRGCLNQRLEKWSLAAQAYASALTLDSRKAEWHYRHGVVLAALQNWPEAIDAYRGALSRDNSCALWHYRLAQSYAAFEDYHGAIKSCQKALKLDAQRDEWHDFLGRLYELTGDFQRAIDSYRFSIQINGNRPDTYFNLALDYRRLGMVQDALDACRRAVEFRQDAATWIYTLATLHEEVADFSSAQKAYETALAKGCALPGWYFNYGRVCASLGETHKAIEAYQQATADEAAPAEWYFCLGESLERLKSWPSAKDAYAKSITKSSAPDAYWYFRLGFVNEYLQQWTDARDAYRQALQLRPNENEWRFRLGYCEEKSGNLSTAEAYFREALNCDARHAVWYFRFGRLLSRQGKWSDARDVYLQALKLSPNKADWYVHLSNAYSACGELPAAIAAVEKALNFEKIAKWQAHYAKLLEGTGNWQAAADNYAQAVLKEPMQADWHHRRGICMRELRRWPDALESFTRASGMYPKRADWQADAAAMMVKSGRVDEAITAYRKALALEPTRRAWHAELWRLLRTSDLQAALEMFEQGAQWADAVLLREAAALLDSQNQILTVPAKSLLRAQRLDIAAKILFARSLLGLPSNNSLVSRTGIYRRHIHLRTGGREPGDLSKTTLHDYQDAFSVLIASMAKNGFDSSFPIPLGRGKGAMLNGAHRLSAAIALGVTDVSITVDDQSPGLEWGFSWFVDKGFKPSELNELLFCWMEENSEQGNIIILWPSVRQHWEAVTSRISSEIPVVTHRDVVLGKFGLKEVATEVFSNDLAWETSFECTEKVDGCSAADTIRFLIVDAPATQLDALKRDLSLEFVHLIPHDCPGVFDTSTSHRVAMQLARILLHEQTLMSFQSRKQALGSDLARRIYEVKQEMSARGIDFQEICVVNDAVLDFHEYCVAPDFEITVTTAVREKYFHAHAVRLTDNINIVKENYAVDIDGKMMTDDQLIYDRAHHIQIRGLKFAALDVVRLHKSCSAADADARHVAGIGRRVWFGKDSPWKQS